MLTINSLKETGSFVSDVPVKKHIEWEIDGEKYNGDIFIRQLGIEEWNRLFITGDKDRLVSASLAAVIRLGENGDEVLTIDQAAKIHPALAGAMMSAARETHSPKKTSPTETDS